MQLILQGAYVYDINGKKYIDALAGLWCTALGMCTMQPMEPDFTMYQKFVALFRYSDCITILQWSYCGIQIQNLGKQCRLTWLGQWIYVQSNTTWFHLRGCKSGFPIYTVSLPS